MLEIKSKDPNLIRATKKITMEIVNNQIDNDSLSLIIDEFNLNDTQGEELFEWLENNNILIKDEDNGSTDSTDTNFNPHILTREEEVELMKKVKGKDPKAKDEALQQLIACNQGLIRFVVKYYHGRGMSDEDLIQEGNIGLLKAIDKYDYTRGLKLATYATWWIRQSVSRAVAEQARTIRIPVRMIDTINQLNRTQNSLSQKLGRDPSEEELAAALKTSVSKIREIQKYAENPVSLDSPVGSNGEDKDSQVLDFIADPKTTDSTSKYSDAEQLKAEVEKSLEMLKPREAQVLKDRFGIDTQHALTLEEIGKKLNISRERVRQIENTALRKLKNPRLSKALKAFVDED